MRWEQQEGETTWMPVHSSRPEDASVAACTSFNLSPYVIAGRWNQCGSLDCSEFCLLVKCSRDRWHNDLPEFLCSELYFCRPNSHFHPSYWWECTLTHSSRCRQTVFTLSRQAMQRENRSIHRLLMLKTWWENIRQTLSCGGAVAVPLWKWPEFITRCICPAARARLLSSVSVKAMLWGFRQS